MAQGHDGVRSRASGNDSSGSGARRLGSGDGGNGGVDSEFRRRQRLRPRPSARETGLSPAGGADDGGIQAPWRLLTDGGRQRQLRRPTRRAARQRRCSSRHGQQWGCRPTSVSSTVERRVGKKRARGSAETKKWRRKKMLSGLEGAGSQSSTRTYASCYIGSEAAKRAAAAARGSGNSIARQRATAGCKWPGWGMTGGPARGVEKGRTADEGAPLGFPKF
jgi:hypothetical protein